MTFTTTLQAIAASALVLHAKGELGYQSTENVKLKSCRYIYDNGARCAIGAGLPLELAQEITQREEEAEVIFAVSDLIFDNTIKITDDYSPSNWCGDSMASQLQVLHDACSSSLSVGDKVSFGQNEARFLFALNELSAGRKPTMTEIFNAGGA